LLKTKRELENLSEQEDKDQFINSAREPNSNSFKAKRGLLQIPGG
jgi:hypothetical protein